MSEINTFRFSDKGAQAIRNYKYGVDWPVVYVIENGNDLYVGETIRAYNRTKQHLEKETIHPEGNIHIISDENFNKSATLDIESSLIEYLIADGQFTLKNSNGGLQNHNYFDREKYQGKFEVLWESFREMEIAKKNLLQIRNSDLFKYSPYKTLTDDQYLIANQLQNHIEAGQEKTCIVHGGAGTGKTILATYLIKQLVEKGYTNVALVIAMTPLRNTLKKVFKSIPDLAASMVIGPSEAVKKEYEVLVVDEAHRLRQRKNIPNYGSFDTINKKLGFGKEGTELDWVLTSTQKAVLLYDEKQSVRPSDIKTDIISKTKAVEFELKTQMRVLGGQEYLTFIDQIFELKNTKANFSNYDFRLYEDIREMIADIKERETEHQLCRVVAGYAWKWRSRTSPGTPDIVIDDVELFWNSQIQDWVNSPNAINEVGCIHTIQGYDLNYTGVIIGPEIQYDPDKDAIVIDKDSYFDANGHRGVSDQQELKRYIINIYKTLLTRGIMGTYVYVVDPHLRKYIKDNLEKHI